MNKLMALQTGDPGPVAPRMEGLPVRMAATEIEPSSTHSPYSSSIWRRSMVERLKDSESIRIELANCSERLDRMWHELSGSSFAASGS